MHNHKTDNISYANMLNRNAPLETLLKYNDSELARGFLGGCFDVIGEKLTTDIASNVSQSHANGNKSICELLSEMFPSIKPIVFFAYFIAKCFELKCVDKTDLHSDIIILRVDDTTNRDAVVIYGDSSRVIDKAFLQRCSYDITENTILCLPREVACSNDIHNTMYMISDNDISRLLNGVAEHPYFGYTKMQLYPHMMCLGIYHKTDPNNNQTIIAYVDRSKGEKLWSIIIEHQCKLYKAVEDLTKRASDIDNSVTVCHGSILRNIDDVGTPTTHNVFESVKKFVSMAEECVIETHKVMGEFNRLMREIILLREKYINSIIAYETIHIDKIAWYTTRIKKIVEEGKDQALEELTKHAKHVESETACIEYARDHRIDV